MISLSSDWQCIDTFGIKSNGTFHGHHNDCLHIYKHTSHDIVAKHVMKKCDDYGIHQKSLRQEYTMMTHLRDMDIPNIANVLDLIETKDSLTMVMEYYDTTYLSYLFSIHKELRATEFSRLVLVIRNLYNNGYAHRDLNIDNIMWDTKREIPILIDFQVARGINNSETSFEESLDYRGKEYVESCCGSFPSKNLIELKETLELWGIL